MKDADKILGDLCYENINAQFCSDWLKNQIRKLLDRVAMAESDTSVKHKYRADVLERRLAESEERHTRLLIHKASCCNEMEDTLIGLAREHQYHTDRVPMLGSCDCEWHKKAAELLEGKPE